MLSAGGGESGLTLQANGGRGGDAWDARLTALRIGTDRVAEAVVEPSSCLALRRELASGAGRVEQL